VLLVVALKTDQPNIERRLKTILAGAEPINVDTEPVAWANDVNDLVAADLDALASLVGRDAVSRLRVGDVASGGSSSSPVEAGGGDVPESPDADGPLLSCRDGEQR
jgi:hypothetical protein